MTIRTIALFAGISLLLTIILWPVFSISKDKSEEAGPAERQPRAELRTDRSPQSSSISAAEFPEGLRREFEAQASGFVAASSGLQTVLNRLKEIPEGRQRETFLNGAFRYAATLGVNVALNWAKELPEQTDRNTALLTLLGQWSGISYADLLQKTELNDLGIAGVLGLHLLSKSKSPPEQVAALADDFLHGTQRANLLAEVAANLASTDAARAVSFGDDLVGEQQMNFLKRFLHAWAAKKPQEAWRWIGQFEDVETRTELQASIIHAMAENNHEDASRLALAIDPTSSARVRSLELVGSYWGAKDTKAAWLWADSLPAESDRQAARKGIQSSAPVGIGAVLEMADDGIPVVSGIIPQGVADRTGALNTGDRILAVMDSEGAWLETRKLSHDEVIQLIRGAPNTRVSLRIQPAAGDGVHTLELKREQIIN